MSKSRQFAIQPSSSRKEERIPKAERFRRIAQEMSGGDQNENARLADKIAADTARYEALAREHGADLSEEGFNKALRKVARQNSAALPNKQSQKNAVVEGSARHSEISGAA